MIAVFSIDHIIQYILTFTVIPAFTQTTLLWFIYIFPGDIILIEVSSYKIRQTQLSFINYFFAWFTRWNFLEVSRLKTRQELLTRSNINTKFILLGFIHFANLHFKITFYFPVKQIAIVGYFIFGAANIAINNQLCKI